MSSNPDPPAGTLPTASADAGGPTFSHIDARGRARMVDVSAKPITRRVAEASCRVLLAETTVSRLSAMPKGDAITVARLAGIQAAKRVDELVPLAHTLALDHVDVRVIPDGGGVRIESEVVATARTGAEIEALVACSSAAVALYDMVKAVEKGAVITDLRLEAKSGGRGGDYRRGTGAVAEGDPPPSAGAAGTPPERES
ncbi:MAG: cyclic pyranopterin monophosphate synthase MoaC [Holophagales bacterium]|nr:cyclic pyranopterin monophosphate synthase MoaC [Holophagales bacterium]